MQKFLKKSFILVRMNQLMRNVTHAMSYGMISVAVLCVSYVSRYFELFCTLSASASVNLENCVRYSSQARRGKRGNVQHRLFDVKRRAGGIFILNGCGRSHKSRIICAECAFSHPP